MKKFILSAVAVLALAGTATEKAQTVSNPPAVTTQDSTSRTPVKLEELPQAVTTTLQSDAYKEWTPSSAFLVKTQKEEYYLIEVKKGQETANVKIGKDGQVIQ